MELIVGSFLLVVVSLFGHIGLVMASYRRRSKPGLDKPFHESVTR
jgi:hypothetical protein